MAEYDLGRAVVKIEVDWADARAGLAAAHAETAREVAAMQRDVNMRTRQMAKDFNQFSDAVKRSTADIATASAIDVRRLDEIASAATRTRVALDALGNSDFGAKMASEWEAAAVAARHSADQQVEAAHRAERAMAGTRFTPGPAGAGPQGGFQGISGANTVSLDAGQYAGLIAAITANRGGGGGTTIVSSGGGGGGGGSSGGAGTAALLSTILMGRHGAGSMGARIGLGPFTMPFPIVGASLGSVGSFAGLGIEHFLMTLLGLGGSAAGGAIGAGLLGGGVLAKSAVGMGSDIAASKTAMANIHNTTQAIDNYNKAVATYGKNSSQAATALKQMNFAIKDMPPALRAQNLAISKANIALENYWKQASAGAVHQTNNIVQQGQRLVREYIPLVAQAAQQNLTIINKGLRPLFSWLRGPDGLAIFNDLEMQFKRDLPTAVHAGDQAFEFLLRLFDQASHHTGGLIHDLDHLFTRLNNLSNGQIDYGIMRFVHMFRDWKDLIKVVAQDLVLLFRNDAGTAHGILQTLTQMLRKVGDWERTISGRERIHSIFQTHKDEILQIIHAIGILAKTFTNLYLTLGPPFTKALTAILTTVNAVLTALEKIPGGTWVVGLGLLYGKFFGISKVVGLLGGGLRTVLGLLGKLAGEGVLGDVLRLLAGGGAAKAGATVAGDAVKVGEATAGGATAGGVAKTVLSRVGGVGALGAFALPAAGFLGMMELMNLIGGPAHPTNIGRFQSNLLGGAQTAPRIQVMGRAEALTPPAFSKGPVGPTKEDIQHLKDWVATTENSKKVAGANAQQLARWHAEGDRLAKLFPKMADEINKDNKYIEAQQRQIAGVSNMMSTHWRDAMSGTEHRLKNLYDSFNTNTGLIARVVGLHSEAGKKLMEQNVDQMVSHTLTSINRGKVGVTAGMKAIEKAIGQGMKDGALTATQAMTRMTNTVESLYKHGRINALQFSQYLVTTFKTYSRQGANVWDSNTNQILGSLAHLHQQGKLTTAAMMQDIKSLFQSGLGDLNHQTNAWYNSQRAYWENLRKKNIITQKELNTNLAQLEQQRNNTSKGNMDAWAGNILNGMIQSGKVSLSGAQAIARQLNELLKALHASPIPVPTSIAVAAYNAKYRSGATHTGQFARGGLAQAGRPGETGADSIPMMIGDQQYVIAPGEQVMVLTDKHQRDFNRMLAPIGGLPGYFARNKTPHGMATGGYVYPIAAGVPIGRTDQGIDPLAPAGKPFGPIGNATILETGGGGWPGGPFMYWRLNNGPMAGRYVYLAEEIRPTVSPGQHVRANQTIAISTGPSQEMGWATAGGSTLARATSGYTEGQVTPAGSAFRAFLSGLSHGQLIMGGMGLGTINDPHVKGPAGPYHDAVQKSLDLATQHANSFYMAKAAASGLMGGTFMGTGTAMAGSLGPGSKTVTASYYNSHGAGSYGLVSDVQNVVGFADLDMGHAIESVGVPVAPGGMLRVGYNGKIIDAEKVDIGAGGPGIGGAIRAVDLTMPAKNALGFPGLANVSIEAGAGTGTGAPTVGHHATGGIVNVPPGMGSWMTGAPTPHHRLPHWHRGMRWPGHGPLPHWRHGMHWPHHGPGGHGHHHHGWTAAQFASHFPHAWKFIKRVSPGFDAKTLGQHWMGWFEDQVGRTHPTSGWDPLPFRSVTRKYMQDMLGWLGHIENGIIPRLQEQSSSIGDFASTHGSTPRQHRQMEELDREVVAWALRGAQAILRTEPVLRHAIRATDPKGKKGSPLSPFLGRLNALRHDFIGVSGRGGLLHDAETTLLGLEPAAGGGHKGPNAKALLALEKQREQQLREQLAVMRRQYRVLNQFPVAPFAGSYGGGGTIPGPVGAPALAVVHGGERVTPPGQSDTKYVVVTPDIPGFGKLINAEIRSYDRSLSRRTSLTLPSRGGH